MSNIKKAEQIAKQPINTTLQPLSKLEQLPDELLLDIFVESGNASLVFASPRLHELANYVSTHNSLINFCCQDECLGPKALNHGHDNLRMLMQEKWLSLG